MDDDDEYLRAKEKHLIRSVLCTISLHTVTYTSSCFDKWLKIKNKSSIYSTAPLPDTPQLCPISHLLLGDVSCHVFAHGTAKLFPHDFVRHTGNIPVDLLLLLNLGFRMRGASAYCFQLTAAVLVSNMRERERNDAVSLWTLNGHYKDNYNWDGQSVRLCAL